MPSSCLSAPCSASFHPVLRVYQAIQLFWSHLGTSLSHALHRSIQRSFATPPVPRGGQVQCGPFLLSVNTVVPFLLIFIYETKKPYLLYCFIAFPVLVLFSGSRDGVLDPSICSVNI